MSDASGDRFVCIHGHFYQPPRENPWLEAVEVQDSAAPYHDWNERVTAECYAPNATARLLDGRNRIVALRNNYQRISFNFGPTLLAWLERGRPDVYGQILQADHDSVRRLGRGNAMAQVYGHCIMPLASPRDQQTQVRWGIADFVHRFGRRPEGMWLPETAVDRRTLAVLAEHGIRFTILAPSQAARARYRDHEWTDVSASTIDCGRPYRCSVGSGHEIILFFYDADISHAIAFRGLLNDGREFAWRLAAGTTGREPGPRLLHIATDGESYGHHHRFGEMALAAALDTLEHDGQVRLTNYAAYLDHVAVRDQVEIHENSSWSCVHGVERWRADCGCNSGGHAGWQQAWRAPLRQALTWLQKHLDSLFERQGGKLLRDPWAARDDYAAVLLQRQPEQRAAFLERHALDPAGAPRVRVWKLLEMQRYMLLSFTSCGWFFDEPTGIETVQVLTYAARAMQLAGEFGAHVEPEFLRHLQPLHSNVGARPNGREIYRQLIRPEVTDSARAVAHYAIDSLFAEPDPQARVYAYRVTSHDRAAEQAGPASLAVGRAQVCAEPTEDCAEYAYVALHLGGHDIHCAVGRTAAISDYAQLKTVLLDIFRAGPLGELIRRTDDRFGKASYTLRDVFTAERRRILEHLTAQMTAELPAVFDRTVAHNRRLLEFLSQSNTPLPEVLRVATTSAVQHRLERTAAAFAAESGPADAVLAAWADAMRWRVAPNVERVRKSFQLAVADALLSIDRGAIEAGVARAHAVLDLAQALQLDLNLWNAQNLYYALIATGTRRWPDSALPELRRLGERLSFDLPEWAAWAPRAA